MEEKAPIRSAMVSRLPKFGGRSSTGGASPLSNGSTQPTTHSQDGKTTPPGTRPNGMIRASPFSLKWKRDEGTTPSSPTTPTSPGDGGEDKAPLHLPSLAKDVKNGSPATPKMKRSGSLMVAVSSPKAIPRQSLKMSPKVGIKLGQSPLNGGPKMGHNACSVPGRTGSESRLVRPRLGSSSPRSSSQDSLSQSSDSLKTMALDSMVRSNSFTHFKQIPSPTSQPMTRSFSFNRAVELAKPLANTQLRPPRSSFLKPPQLSNGRVGLGLGGLNGSLGGSGGQAGGLGGLQYNKTPSVATSLPTLSIPPGPSTPSALRKPLLPSCVLTKSLGSSGSPLGYRLPRSGQTKQQKPLFPGRVKGDIRSSTAPECRGLLGIAIDSERTDEADKADLHSDSDGSSGDGGVEGGSGVPRQNSCQTAGEPLEDMSLSSASSIDRGDTSEEFLDDFYSVGDVLSDGDLPDNRKTGNDTRTRLHSFLNETLDWDNMDLEGPKDESPMQDSQGPLVLSSERSDILQASSVELSPSNSSGGTYMWDEDGLEPLGGPGAHPCESYDDSELNSMDILNNLDPPGTGELDDDDLMLDVDLPEDGLHEVHLHSFSHCALNSACVDPDRMSHFERSERAGRQGQRRKHHRWSGPDNFHNDNRAHVFQHYDGLKASKFSSRPVPSEGRQRGYIAMLDELTLEHMTQDCSSLKNQLLRLKTLLQLEDTDSPADVPEETEDNTTASQVEELIKEVQVLREELRSRDKTIAQLTLQCQQLQQHQREQMPAQGRQFRCQCHHQRAPSSVRQGDRPMDKRMQHHYDKATQTYCRLPSHAGVLPTPLLSPWQAQHQVLTRTSMPQRRQTSNTTAFHPLPQRAPPPGKTSKNSPHRGPQ
ncbi:serine-rich coiled-coil domain-containing protein 2 isoform X1 [Acanthopagrus latus]|uniref:serine-rich coiled-coil domain-containing protein 2 isoform X1 n=1 Tax=Acanthopagrus latus TaxID=8177 RepID=UPI00187C4FF6|nr:serine-rich coiled-coil domain-containing protein 2 isoform X1 [Acanthopagrus latus]XP_036979330.1 serine-rich coiled-coil domain-containing protein 2 isoform X1 [Acanthopagrus latus]XP_036979331.1 serine-rich coiled-coil domain-containing protein 2 isoform X1 [Acanthopagrus latus]XP_036979332.1 serine-rich coiled-coil domain-containing protein 2 isoform X1 [Acanthopagrus latus]